MILGICYVLHKKEQFIEKNSRDKCQGCHLASYKHAWDTLSSRVLHSVAHLPVIQMFKTIPAYQPIQRSWMVITYSLEYHKCRVSTGGTEYMGDINKTSTGANCLNWAQLRQEEAFTFTDQSFPEGSIEGAANYCRNPDGGDPKGPWCFSQELNSVTHEKTYCHIPYCGKYIFKYVM